MGVLATVLPRKSRPSEQLDVAADLLRLSRAMRGDPAARASGIANMMAGRCAAAVTSLETLRARDAADWNDLAAANVCAARQNGGADRWLAALAAADSALSLAPDLAEALFNRAAIVDALGITPVARSSWSRYLLVDSISPWAQLARRRLSALHPSDDTAWRSAMADLGAITATEMERLTDRYPQSARRYSDFYLTAWATALQRGDPLEAAKQLAAARVIARTLRRRGESLLDERIAVIDSADPARLQILLRGELAYLNGRLSLRDGAATAAEQRFRDASRLFAEGGSPMALTAEFWLASALTEQQRLVDAADILRSLTSRLESRGRRYRALLGHNEYQLALIEAVRGNWSKSLAAATRSAAQFAALEERGNLAAANAILSEDYDLLGQPERAWIYGFAAMRDSTTDGAFDRTRVALAVLCRTELRGGRWSRARALARLEAELAPVTRDVRLDPDMFIRTAVAEWRGGDRDRARYWMQLARRSAERVTEPATRRKLLADVDGAEGAFEGMGNLRKAIQLLSAAIVFQQNAARPILMPELYLARGRAFAALRQFGSAESDYDQGLAELERQRGQVFDAELRPGIFESASALFDSAIALQLDRGTDPEQVWRYVERGRARGVLEAIHARDDTFITAAIPRIADVQRELPRATALLEYVSLPERLVAFVITKDRTIMQTLPLSRANLSYMAEAFANGRGGNGGPLYNALAAPLREHLKGVEAINIVVDDVMQRIPFAALFDSEAGVFLIERHALAMSPSAGALIATMARTNRLPAVDTPAAMVVANPTVPRDEFGVLPSLNAAEHEARAIARSYARSETFTGEAATAERFCNLAAAREVVHFAGHGVIREREPFASALVFAASPRRPGALTVRDISRMSFRRTRTVVLSACSTMTGRNAAIEGVPSLARAFVVAGVPAVVGTLWDIEDGDAALVMRPLHERLARGAAPAHALRAAQVEAIRRGLPVSQWSAFALMGSAGLPTKS
jgi:CHAT domain-containing protein